MCLHTLLPQASVKVWPVCDVDKYIKKNYDFPLGRKTQQKCTAYSYPVYNNKETAHRWLDFKQALCQLDIDPKTPGTTKDERRDDRAKHSDHQPDHAGYWPSGFHDYPLTCARLHQKPSERKDETSVKRQCNTERNRQPWGPSGASEKVSVDLSRGPGRGAVSVHLYWRRVFLDNTAFN